MPKKHLGNEHEDSCSYFAFNPGMLDTDHFGYRDLQRLCKRAGLKASGKRSELISRLQIWHKAGRHGANVNALHACGKFALLGVHVGDQSQDASSDSGDAATPSSNSGEGKPRVSPRLLSPLLGSKSRRLSSGSILRKKSRYTYDSPRCRTPGGSRLVFSPYTMVKVMTPPSAGSARSTPPSRSG